MKLNNNDNNTACFLTKEIAILSSSTMSHCQGIEFKFRFENKGKTKLKPTFVLFLCLLRKKLKTEKREISVELKKLTLNF